MEVWTSSFSLQKGIANAIRRICDKQALKPILKESAEELKIYLFSQAMQTPKTIIQLLEKFDYSQLVPKLILYNNEQTGSISRSDAALLLLLNQFGIDIILYNPSGHNDIEAFLTEALFDTHWLEEVVFDQEFKEPSLIKKGLFSGFLKNLRGD
ncbi:YceG family protein [Neobacillus sp. PS3-34]|uniref:YceG family protein n=1 Tax=Neobacillus sp. PS3-34 TaxID=3070678 RepID=UPI0035A6B2DF